MSVQRYKPSDPREWLNRARSNLERAAVRTPHSYLEDLCFDAQQGAEKAIKAVLLARRIQFPYVHDLDELLGLARRHGITVPPAVGGAGALSRYAFSARYPGIAREVTEQQHEEALAVSEAVLHWAEEVILGKNPSCE